MKYEEGDFNCNIRFPYTFTFLSGKTMVNQNQRMDRHKLFVIV